MRDLELKVVRYCLMEKHLYWRDPTRVLLKCVDENEAQRIMIEIHIGVCGGHLYWKATTNKIL